MGQDGTSALTELFRQLVRDGIIKLDLRQGQIKWATLNPKDNRAVTQEVVRAISIHLYNEVAMAGMDYDAIASVPTGGDPYAAELARIVEQLEGRLMPLIRLEKGVKYPERVVLGHLIASGTRVLVVDDALVDGMTALHTIMVLRRSGCEIAGGAFAANYERVGYDQLKRVRKCMVVSVFSSSLMRVVFAREYAEARNCRNQDSFLC